MAKPRKKSKGTSRRNRRRATSRGSFRRTRFLSRTRRGATIIPENLSRSPQRSLQTRPTRRSMLSTLSRARNYLGKCSTRACRTRKSTIIAPMSLNNRI